MSISVPVPIHTVSIHILSRLPTEADIEHHRIIRLESLRTDPGSFLSTYAQESKVDDAKRRERLEQEGVWTFYAKSDEVDQFGADAHIPPKPWLGILTLFSPVFLKWFLASSCTTPITTNTVSSRNPSWPLSLLNSGTDLWLIAGLWVRPEWRRNHIAQQIVQKVIHSVTTSPNHSHPDDIKTLESPPLDACQSYSRSCNSKTTIILLEVFARNTAAVKFYQRVGFEILSNPNQPSCVLSQVMGTRKNGRKVRGGRKMEEQVEETYWMGYTIPQRSNL